MSTTKVAAYCRLCATLKPLKKLIDLNRDDTKRVEVITKLARLNSDTDFTEDVLPRTVCIECTSNLDKAFDFIVNIENAKTILYNILLIPTIKVEIKNDSDEDYSPDETDLIKQEEEEDIVLASEESNNKKKFAWKRPIVYKVDALPETQQNLTWADYMWTCCYCETQFSTVEELKMHSISIHNCCNAFRCDDCHLRKLRLDSFIVHVKRHRRFLKFSCYICLEKFKNTYEASRHKKVHAKVKFTCEGCNEMFPTQEMLNEHKKYFESKRKRKVPDVNETTSEGLTCLMCNKTFSNKGSLTTHLLIHTERKRDHTCEICGKCFFSKQHLAGHLIYHDNARPHQCEICKTTFKTITHLRSHVKVHDNNKPFSCDQCGRCFRLKKQLASHTIVHTDEMPYSCSYCDKKFRFKSILNQHIRQHTGDRPYSCHLCERKFTNWPNYNKHMKGKHKTNMAKRKHTPEGVFPVDPVTGEVVITPETNEILEWKEDILRVRRRGPCPDGMKKRNNMFKIYGEADAASNIDKPEKIEPLPQV